MNKKKIIVDPVHGEIVIDDSLFIDLISTKEFRRLTRINHLGFTDFVFPSATYTRYPHSLGAYEIARRSLKHLDPNLDLFNKRVILSAALLHDLGHGILSHSFESISKTKHEYYTIKIIENEQTEINKIFKKYDPFLIKEVVLLLKGKHHLKWANNLISSEIDVDRIDYLMRDSYFTGASYGRIDLNWFFNNMKIFEKELVFKYKFLPVIENIILARMNMNKNVYKNIKNISLKEQFIWFFNRLKFLNDNSKLIKNYDLLLKPLYFRKMEIKDFLELDDYFFYAQLKKIIKYEKDNTIVKIANNILDKKIPKIFEKEDQINNLEKDFDRSNKLFTWNIIDMKKDKNNNYLYTEKKDEAKILWNNKIYLLRDISTIIKRESTSNMKIINTKLGVSL